jgi:hypothetical protein
MLRLFNNMFFNYIPILPGINISKFIYNNNHNIKTTNKTLQEIFTQSGIIIINLRFPSNIFIISLPEYIDLKLHLNNIVPDYIHFFTITGSPHYGNQSNAVPLTNKNVTDRQKILMTIVSLINGMYNFEFSKDPTSQKIYQNLLAYYNDINRGGYFMNIINDSIQSKYNQNNNNIDGIIKMFPKAIIEANQSFKIKYLKQYIINKAQKYKQKYLQLKNNIN